MAKRKLSTSLSGRPSPAGMNAAARGCKPHASMSVGQASAGVGPEAHALGVDPDIKAANLKHLKRIEGQVRGIAAMIEEDRYCADIIQQAAAVQESLRSVAKNLLKNHLRHCAADALHKPGKKREDMIEEVLNLVGRIAR